MSFESEVSSEAGLREASNGVPSEPNLRSGVDAAAQKIHKKKMARVTRWGKMARSGEIVQKSQSRLAGRR